jgi:hypothetical protein
MRWRSALLRGVAAVALFAGTGAAQARRAPDITGTWRAQTPEGPREVVVRPDSSASYGQETVRWRLAGDSLYLAFGDEWVAYRISLRGSNLTVSGGDLEEPMKLKRIGPPSPRPDSIPLPPAPPMSRRGSASGTARQAGPPGPETGLP